MIIPFNKPYIIGKELNYIKDAVENKGKISGDGYYTQKCHELLEKKFKIKKVLLTTSCTSALEMAGLLCNLQKGDEFIVPSFTFVSTANAFILRGAKPVFIDIREDTKNMDENLIEELITQNTKVIVPVHYAGIGCNMEKIMQIAQKYNLYVIEDAAQGVYSKYKNHYLGSIGHFGTYSFHETKNYICGEGGALLINDERFIERAEIIREKGTNRNKFFRGEVDKYTWVDIGSSYLPSDILAAYLYAQLEKMEDIYAKRKFIFDYYYNILVSLEKEGYLKLPVLPSECQSNYHMFYIVVESQTIRDNLMLFLRKKGIYSVFHYIPLHSSPMGKTFHDGRPLPITEKISATLLRLPFYYELSTEDIDVICEKIIEFFKG